MELDTTPGNNYKCFPGREMELAQELGLSEQEISSLAQKFGSYLAHNVNPDLPENRAMKELWEIANPQEQQTLTNLMMRVVKSAK